MAELPKDNDPAVSSVFLLGRTSNEIKSGQEITFVRLPSPRLGGGLSNQYPQIRSQPFLWEIDPERIAGSTTAPPVALTGPPTVV
jgi:hypothetical protein